MNTNSSAEHPGGVEPAGGHQVVGRFRAWWQRQVAKWIADDPNPEPSRLDRMDGLPRVSDAEVDRLRGMPLDEPDDEERAS